MSASRLPEAELAVVDRLVGGYPVDDLPSPSVARFAGVASLLDALNRPATAAEQAEQTAAAATFVAARAAYPRRPYARRHVTRPPVRRRIHHLVAAACWTFLTLTATAIAASVGALPQPVDRLTHDAFATVGVHLPGTQAVPQLGPTPAGTPSGDAWTP